MNVARPLNLILFTLFLGLQPLHAGSATWNSNPIDGDWNNAANWTPATVPSDTASFATSDTTDIAFSAPTTVTTMLFLPGASAYTFTCPAAESFSVESGSKGDWINNLSGLPQNFIAGVNGSGQAGNIIFDLYATSSNNTIFTTEAPWS